ncbi:DNA/RNA non-specific endonuclease [Candidatus Woesearchaeota archaeon]|nr:DNA/RNA non-specific endonuclease [Candidatus Woesearchaeota archaeon]
MAYLGLPTATDWKQPLTWTRVFRNEGFIVGYSELRGNPLWVTYLLSPPPVNPPHLPRPARFTLDWRSLTRINHEDFSNSGYDRGHLAPNHAISVLYGRSAQFETFLMTNISPQRPDLNRKVWERLEEVELDRLASRFGKLWVITGPVFDHKMERLSSAFRVEIPDSFYKIYAIPNSNTGKTRVLAFMIPQSVRGHESLSQYLTTVDQIEARTGLDFFIDLDDAVENQLEAGQDTREWQVEAWSALPGRYSEKATNRRSHD